MLDREAAWRWAPEPAAPAPAATLRAGCRALLDALPALGPADGLGALLCGAAPAFPLEGAAPQARSLARACAADDPGGAVEAATALLGLGPGLTPSGDDYVGGAFFSRALVAEGYAAFSNKEAFTVAATSLALQWALQRAIHKLETANEERAREAARTRSAPRSSGICSTAAGPRRSTTWRWRSPGARRPPPRSPPRAASCASATRRAGTCSPDLSGGVPESATILRSLHHHREPGRQRDRDRGSPLAAAAGRGAGGPRRAERRHPRRQRHVPERDGPRDPRGHAPVARPPS